MAAEYAKNNFDSLDGLIMFASYPANYQDFVDFPIPILTIIWSRDPGAVKQEAFYDAISNSASLFVIEGGNHRQFADYNFQRDDGVANDFSRGTARTILDFIRKTLKTSDNQHPSLTIF